MKISKYIKYKLLGQSLFNSEKEPWWLIGFSMILSSGLMIEPQLICASLVNGELSDMWLYWSAGIGSAFSISFFAHLWQNIPVKTENEFIFFRFSGIGAKLLHTFRSLYLGLLIIPFIISFSLLAFAKICCFIFKIDLVTTILSISSILVLLTFLNSFRLRLRMDFILFFLFIIIGVILFINLYSNTGGLYHLSNQLKTKGYNFSIIPSIGSKGFNAFLIFIMVQWWSASILDYPDMNGQKLMASRGSNDLVKSIFLPTMFVFLFRILLFTLPFMAVVYGFAHHSSDNELVFTALFSNLLPSWMLVLVVLFFIITFLSFVQNTQNWGGSLLVENFYKHSINPNMSAAKSKRLGLLAMVYILIISIIIAIYANSLIEITKYLFAITAGVGPVFMLRWYWWRINAWSQLSAMLAALVYPPILDVLNEKNAIVHQFIINLETNFNVDYYPIKIVILTITVCLTWLGVTFCTAPTETQILQTFASTVKPGGFWKSFENSGKSFSKIRYLAWLIQAGNGILTYFIFYNFLVGQYFIFWGLLILFISCFFISYKLIQRANFYYSIQS
ncbi:hypothetical protein [uncultured Flavobacterium sp.]|uniref:sodium:solute symporter family transporter n=1 Tax=uncultured Flavobacterium sp. TaxID=165435 RepID=UPI00260E74AA|nr:hypothetical protein [uncultured Flavobacterium sp.]